MLSDDLKAARALIDTPGREMEAVVCIATDAFRLCIGIPPRNFGAEAVIAWLRAINAEQAEKTNG